MLHLAVPLLLAAAPVPAVSTPAPARLEISLAATPDMETCPGALSPEPWADPSNPWFFATGPTARLDQYELSAGVLASLVDLRFVSGALRLFVLGSPIRPGLQFTTAGWRPRWPFC